MSYPWRVDPADPYQAFKVSDDGGAERRWDTYVGTFATLADCELAVACVNACSAIVSAGIEDDVLAALRDADEDEQTSTREEDDRAREWETQ